MPLDQAVYIPAVGPRAAFIAAVFGGTIYHLNPTTGVKISQSRFAATGMSPSCLTYEPNLDRIIAAVWNDPGISIAADESVLDFRYIYYINPTTLAVTATYNIWDTFYGFGGTPPCPTYSNQAFGIRCLEYKSGKVYATAVLPYTNTGAEALQFNAANPAVGFVRSTFTANGTVWSTGSADTLGGTREIMWVGDNQQGFIYGFDILGGGSDDVQTVFEPPDFNPYGLAFDPAGYLWAGYLNGRIKKFNIGTLGVTPPLVLTVNLLRPNFTAFFVRYNPYNGKVYAAGYADNTVAEITPPSTGLVKTGFDLPLDLVFTPTKIFAVQHGSVGLKEVT